MRESTTESVPADKTGADFFYGGYRPKIGRSLRSGFAVLRGSFLRASRSGTRSKLRASRSFRKSAPFTSLTGVSTCVRAVSAVDCRHGIFRRPSNDKKN